MAKESDLTLMEMTLLQIGKKAVFFLELFEDPADSFNVGLARVLGMDQNVVQIHDNKNIELFGEDLIDVALKAS